MPGFRQRILDERAMRLVRFGNAEGRLRDDLDPEWGKETMEFAQLAGVVGREDEARNQEHRLVPAVARVTHRARPSGAVMSRRIPSSARLTRTSISSRVNGAPSAVPCTSTKLPPAVITTFMSVSHAESSA
jgi:hypothetical protein